MAEEVKEKLLEAEEVRQRIEKLRVSVDEMAAYIGIDDRRRRLADLEGLQAGADFRLVPGVRIYLAPVVSQYLNRSAYANGWDEKPQFSLRAGLSFDL